MKPIVILVSVCLLIIFGLSIRNSVNSFQNMSSVSLINDTTIYGFDPELNKNKEFNDLEAKISKMIVVEKTAINKYSTWNIALNLFITIITGLTTLLTTISTIKNNSVSKSVAILVAAITFICSLVSYSLGQVNTIKEGAESKKQKIIKVRDELESLKPSEVNSQLPLFNRKLDEEL